MSISNQQARYPYTVTLVNQVLPFPNKFYAATDLSVISIDPLNFIETPLVLNTDYTVSGAGLDAGGNVTLIGDFTGRKLVIYRNGQVVQPTSLPASGQFPSASLVNMSDRTTMLLQQLLLGINSSLRFSQSKEPLSPLVLSDFVGKALGFDDDGNPIGLLPSSVIVSPGQPIVFANVAALAFAPTTNLATNQNATLLGYYSPGDGGGGDIYLDLSSSATVDGGKVFATNTGVGRWIRPQTDTMDLRQWGCRGDYNFTTGLGTDDSARITAALNWWRDSSPGVTLRIPRGGFTVANPVRITFSSNQFCGRIEGDGGYFCSKISPINGTGTLSINTSEVVTGVGTSFLTQMQAGDQIVVNGTAYSVRAVTSNTAATIYRNNASGSTETGQTFVVWPPAIFLYADGNVRRPEFVAMRFQGHSSVTAGSLFAIHGQNASTKNWDGVVFDDFQAENFYNTAFESGSGVFESNLYSFECQGQDAGNRDVMRILAGTAGDSSSIHLFSPNLRGGSRGLFSLVSDLHIYGCTAILASFSGVELQNYSGTVTGMHLENNYAGKSPADGQAGLTTTCIRGASFSGVNGVRNSSNGQKHTMRVFASGTDVTLVNPLNASVESGDTVAYVQTSGVGSITIIGTENLTKVFGQSNVTTFAAGKVKPALISWLDNFVNYAATITPDLTRGALVDIANITGAFTLNNPTGITPQVGDEWKLMLRAESTGGYAVTLGTDYAPASSLSTSTNKLTIITWMRGSNNKWCEISRSIL